MNRTPDHAPNVGAFFDLDGTLLARPSLELRMLRFLWSNGALSLASGLRWIPRFLQRMLAWNGGGLEERWLSAVDGNKAHLTGARVSGLDTFVSKLAHQPLRFFPGALRHLMWHVAQDHAIFIVTGSLGPLALCAAWQLSVRLMEMTGGKQPRIHVRATQLGASDGKLTGEVMGQPICGKAKAGAVEEFALEQRLDLRDCFAYGDHWSDRWMLESVGRPAVVNPSRALARLARRRGWPRVEWRCREDPGAERSERGARGEEVERDPDGATVRAGTLRTK